MKVTSTLFMPFLLAFLWCGCGDGENDGGGVDFLISSPDCCAGNATVTGTVAWNPDASAGRGFQFGIVKAISGSLPGGSPWMGSHIKSSPLPRAGTEFTYKIEKLEEGHYGFFVRLDLTGDLIFGSGDLGGYSGGTKDNPIQDPENAQVVEISAEAPSVVDFGLGTIQ